MSTSTHCPTCTGPLEADGSCLVCEHFARVRQARKAALWRAAARPRKWRPIVPKAADGRPVYAQAESSLPPSDRRDK